MKFLLKELRVSARGEEPGIDARLCSFIATELHVAPAQVQEYTILQRAVDSRKGAPHLCYKLLVDLDEALAHRFPAASEQELAALKVPELELPPCGALQSPVVIGTGPAGIFGALALALAGAKPLVLDRGPMISERSANYRKFLETRVLDEESNLLIGEGGAGAFSDGKLYTGTHDVRGRFVLENLIRCGAPPELRYRTRPHVGSDLLHTVSLNLRRRVVELGGKFRFNCRVLDLEPECSGGVAIRTESGVISAPAVLLAPGLGGRGLVRDLCRRVNWEFKPFQMGCRIEHPQEFIDRCQYHGSRPEALGAAEYHLVSRPAGERWGVSSFCMCPGGTIVNATAWSGASSTNGMSDYARSGEFANGCLIATMPPDYLGDLAAAERLISRIERKLFESGGGDYTFPAQDAAAFLNGQKKLFNRRTSCDVGITPGRIDMLLDPALRTALGAALRHFDRQLPGFIRNGKIVGVESCVSSPVRLLRSEYGETSLPGLFAAGEGVGAAGGIISAACDGIRAAEGMLRRCAAGGRV